MASIEECYCLGTIAVTDGMEKTFGIKRAISRVKYKIFKSESFVIVSFSPTDSDTDTCISPHNHRIRL